MADLWSEKAKIVEEEALLLTKKASDFEAENQRVKALAVKVEVHLLCNSCLCSYYVIVVYAVIM